MFFYSDTEFKPECCVPPYSGTSSANGCACITKKQVDYLIYSKEYDENYMEAILETEDWEKHSGKYISHLTFDIGMITKLVSTVILNITLRYTMTIQETL